MKPKNFDKQITDNIPEIFFIWESSSDKIIHLSYGYESAKTDTDSSLKERLLDYIDPDERPKMLAILKNSISKERKQYHELKANDQKYPAKWLSLKIYLVANDKGRMNRMLGHMVDITAQRQEIHELEQEVQHSEDMAHMLAHDIKGPMSNITTLAGLIQSKLQEGNIDEGLKLTDMLIQIVKDGNDMIENILSVLTYDHFAAHPHQVPTKAEPYLHTLVQDFQSQAMAYGITLNCQTDNPNTLVTIDKILFRQALSNLITNALKFTHPQGTVTLQMETHEEDVLFNVRDNGIGIPEEKLQKLFVRFSNVQRKGIRGEKSIGLGLSLVRKIVESHQGSIQVESSSGSGSTFTIRLPRYKSADADISN